MVILHCYCYSSYWQINWQIYPPVVADLVVNNGNMTFIHEERTLADYDCSGRYNVQISTVRAHIDRSTGTFTPPIVVSSGQEWQFHISYC